MMDDGIGINLVEDLNKHILNSNIGFIIGESDFDYCNSIISKDDYLIVIDAYLSGKNAGEITIISISDLNRSSDNRYSIHGMHFLQDKFDGILIGIEPHEINYGLCLSSTLQNCYRGIYTSVYEQVKLFVEKNL